MEKILLMFFVCIISSTYAQSKKEQIENLNYQIDSLNQVLLKEQKLNTNSTFEISQLNAELTRLNASISSLNAEVSKLTSSLKSNQEELSKLQAQLKVKSDSLLLVQKELNKLKSPPIQINNTPALVSQQIGPFKTVQIGTQVWMTKNLDVSSFRNGDPIPEAKTDEEWKKAEENKQPAWCYYDNNSANGAKYGKLYNWYAVNDPRGLAPIGFRVPTDEDWIFLRKTFDDGEFFFKRVKEIINTTGWFYWADIKCPNCRVASKEYKKTCPRCKGNQVIGEEKILVRGTNTSGFSALPGGRREMFLDLRFDDIGESTYWWSSTMSYRTISVWAAFVYENVNWYSEESKKYLGLSVRCIKD